ncbi:ichor [Drosophila kikkawai]|uniref:Early growth response protein 1 n=1 Tax=Drosophila kikkawai TaxID=30033 RepID=A0A6P4J9U9_DROKI|nr:ichor [Drosophila kikkawai]XP_017031839.1 ichor [Drosophila kikkawai]
MTMKFCSMNGPSESEVESLLMSPCWGPPQTSAQDQYLLDGHKLLLEHDLDSLPSDADQKNSLDVLDNLLLNGSSLNALSDLKPLPPFTGYTGHLSINGISGHHYHAIAQRLPDESNNNYMQSAYQSNPTSTTQSSAGVGGSNSSNSNSNEHNIVSSSTCLPESVLSGSGGGNGNGGADACLADVKLFADSQLDSKLYSVADSCVMSGSGTGSSANGNNGAGPSIATLTPIDQVADSLHNSGVRIYKDLTEYVDMNSIDDIAAIIGSAIADTTVPNQMDKDDNNDTRDSWMDLDAWIDGNCIQQESAKVLVSQQDSLGDFMLPHSPLPMHASSSTLQSLLSHGYMPLLQNRLQNGPPNGGSSGGGGSQQGAGGKGDPQAPTSTSYCNELAAATSSSCSPPGSVVSTTDNPNGLMINPRYLSNPPGSNQATGNPHQQGGYPMQNSGMSLKDNGLCSPDLLGNYPHTTTASTTGSELRTGTPKAKRSRSQKKSSQQQQQQQQQQQGETGGPPNNTPQMSAISPSGFSASDLSGLLGKEKPVHRCSICNRGFLNKSNIKVHLRTHTGEKPFRCDVCAKAFRQKAHLLKHQQIHKRIGRD